MEAATSGAKRRPGVRAFWASLTGGQRRTLLMMVVVVVGLHVLGFVTLISLVAPTHYRLGTAGAFTIGIGVTAYTLGLRHAFDADHISAIDNTTRKLMAEGKRPLSVGFWFSLGHSTIVFALAFLISVGVRALDGPVKNDNSDLHQVTNSIGTLVSGTFLYVIAAINVVILFGIVKVFREMRTGRYDEQQLEEQLNKRGLMNRFLGRLTRTRHQAAADVPDRAAVRARVRHRHRGRAARARRRRRRRGAAVVRDPVSADPVRRRHVADGLDRRLVHELRLRLGVLEAGPQGLLQPHDHGPVGRRGRRHRHDRTRRADRVGANLTGSFWNWFENININLLGFVIVGMFVATWAIALSVWRFGRIEERWSASLEA